MTNIHADIIQLEKIMHDNPSAATVMALAEKYVESGQPHQAVAVLIEGTETFPEHLELHYLCARFVIMYQPDEIPRAETLIKTILAKEPDNTVARQLLESIMTCVDTMHEVALPYGSDLSNLPTIKTSKVNAMYDNVQAGEKEVTPTDIFPEHHTELTDGFKLMKNMEYEEAISVFTRILEDDPENTDAREGFRLAYAGLVKKRETFKHQKRIEVVGRTIQFLEAMQDVARQRYRKGSGHA
jgi:tetratricopeptide (TPR) repeat protein